MKKIAFLGLGVMGAPMAGHLAEKGHDVRVYNRSPQKVTSWLETYKGSGHVTPSLAAKGADFVISCVGNDDDLRQVCIGENGAFDAMQKGAIFIDHTTTSASVAKELATKIRSFGLEFMDAPVSGGQAGAQNGVLAVMCGAKQTVFEQSLPIMEAYGKQITRIGDVGCGQQCKMVNQIAIAGLLQGLSEAMVFLQKAGLDGDKVLEVITGGAAGSWQMSNRAKTMLADEFDFGFAVDWMRKDLGIVLEEGQNIDAPLKLTSEVNEYYAEIQKMGGGRWDTSSLIKRLK